MNSVTQDQIDRLVASSVVDTMKVGTKTTVCVITLPNGFEVVGTSACVDPKNYDHEVGTKYAKQRAIDKIWELEGYRLQSNIMENLEK